MCLSKRRDAGNDVADAARLQDESKLVGWDQLPDWQRDNEFILTKYHRASYSYTASLRSLFEIHNETINMWSHLARAGLFIHSMIEFWSHVQADGSLIDFADASVVSIYYLSVQLCFILSTIFHVFLNHSPGMHTFGSHVDHVGIVIVIWGSTIPPVYFGFYEKPFFVLGYWTMSTVAAISCAISTLQPKFRARAYRRNRVLTYFSLGASAFIPFIHSVFMYGWSKQNLRMSISNFIGLAVFNGSGAVIYGLRTPERWYPKRFDILGSSHQIMHVLVICGALVHLQGILSALEYSIQHRDATIELLK